MKKRKKNSRAYEVPDEFADILLVMDMGAKKHGPNNWLEPNGNKSDHVSRHNSVFHHVAESYAGKIADDESGLHPLLHAAVGCLMLYTRHKKGLIHNLDKGRFKSKELDFLDEFIFSDGELP